MKPDLCIYHGNCADGFASAWTVWKRWGDAVEFFPATYGSEPPDVAGKHVLMVDFSYKLPVLKVLGQKAQTVTILDHHKTAQADLAPFAAPSLDAVRSDAADFRDSCEFQGQLPVRAFFDMERSGAMLAWEFIYPGELAPELVQYVQDRDLWRFAKPRSREVAATLFSHPYDFAVWDGIARDLQGDGYSSIVAQGEAIERKHFKDIKELLSICTREMVIGGHRVKVANLPYTMSSDAAGALAAGQPFGACYFDRGDGQRVFSLRSKPEGLDVAEIAASYGGGGHKHASGFQMPLGWEGDPR
jgi:oligoribonuclease NrnB/cAMP/cGMP phosphodiesterase (DHH superfamily)